MAVAAKMKVASGILYLPLHINHLQPVAETACACNQYRRVRRKFFADIADMDIEASCCKIILASPQFFQY